MKKINVSFLPCCFILICAGIVARSIHDSARKLHQTAPALGNSGSYTGGMWYFLSPQDTNTWPKPRLFHGHLASTKASIRKTRRQQRHIADAACAVDFPARPSHRQRPESYLSE